MTVSNYSFVFNFESNFDEIKAVAWMKEHWTDSFYYGLFYLIVIFKLKNFMENRAAYRLKVPLVLWNTFLAVFSVVGTLRSLPELLHTLKMGGIHQSICDRSFALTDEVTRVWVFLFVLSKGLELFDTVFIVLRKHPLIFLHWYHHISTLVYAWWGYTEVISNARWFYVMNFFVHSIMYSYYALRGLGYKITKQVSVTITTLQILQMIVGCLVNSYTLIQIQKGIKCETSILNVTISLILYFSVFILFVKYFRSTYMLHGRRENKED